MDGLRAQICRLEVDGERWKRARSNLEEELERTRKEKVDAQVEHTLSIEQAIASQHDAEAALKALKVQASATKAETSSARLGAAFKIERESMQSRIKALESQ